MQNKKKPHLAGIQEFRAATYMKDLKAGKLDARAKIGPFVGYDSESKGLPVACTIVNNPLAFVDWPLCTVPRILLQCYCNCLSNLL